MNYTEITCKTYLVLKERLHLLTLFIVEKSLSQFTLETGMTSPAEARRQRFGYISAHSSFSLARSCMISACVLSFRD